MSPQSTEQETKSGHDQEQVPCELCGQVQPSDALEWWCDTTPLGEPLDKPIQVCRAAVACCVRMRDQVAF